jgi:hypothetical protein
LNKSSGGKGDIYATAFDLSLHFVFTFLLAWYFRVSTGGWAWPVLCVVGGILIDVDHFIDYFLHYRFRFDLGDFFSHRYCEESGKYYMFFHSFELLILMWVIALFVAWIIPVVTGMSLHLAIDLAITRRRNPISLSLLYRWKNGFDAKKILPRNRNRD